MTTRFWHGFADMHVVKGSELVFRSAEGVHVEDVDGRWYIDATAALWYCNVGYGRAEIADAVAAQIRRLPAYSGFGAYCSDTTLALADRLSAMSPIPDSVVFLGSGGSDAIDTAAKLARRYWDAVGRPAKQILVSREHAYHGMHAWGTELAGIPANRAGYGAPIIDAVERVGWDDLAGLEALFVARADGIAAFIGEPVIGAGGVIPPGPGYWKAVADLCRRFDILLIADEVITGFGRTGRAFGVQRYDFDPDIIAFAKGVTSGYVPLGGLLVGRRVQEPFWEGAPGQIFRHGYTYSGHATACAAALANLDILERERLIERVAALEAPFAAAMHRLDAAPLVSEVRTVGLTAAVEIDAAVRTSDPGVVERVVTAARDRGVLSRALAGRALQVSPPFVIAESEVDEIVAGFAGALEEVADRLPARA